MVEHVPVVGDHDGGDSVLVGFSGQEGDDLLTAFAVQRRGGLVDEQQTRSRHQCACDAHALAFSTGELMGAAVRTVGHTHFFEHLHGVPRLRDPPESERQPELVDGGQGRQQVGALEHEADLRASDGGQITLRRGDEVGVADLDSPCVGFDETSGDRQEAGLA